MEDGGAALRILNLGGETVDTKSAPGKLILTIFAGVVVQKLVGDARPYVPGGGVAWRWIGADVDDDRRAVADDDWLGGPSRNRGAAPTVPTPPPQPQPPIAR